MKHHKNTEPYVQLAIGRKGLVFHGDFRLFDGNSIYLTCDEQIPNDCKGLS